MLKQTEDKDKIESIKKNQLLGIELQTRLYSIATTNMILRGDGKSNLRRDDIFHVNENDYNEMIDKILINPPYSQAKKKELAHLSEISFIKRALELLKTGGKLAAIVPQSTMICDSYEKIYKKKILENNTLEMVITLNEKTFDKIGTNPCIAIFTAGFSHPPNKKVLFINFKDDGYIQSRNAGLIGNGTEKSKKEYLFDVINGNVTPDKSFLLKEKITWEDDWLHTYFYNIDFLPTDQFYEQKISEYISFKAKSRISNREYLFTKTIKETMEEVKDSKRIEINDIKKWKLFSIDELFSSIKKGKRLTKINREMGKYPLLTAIDNNNGVSQFIDNEKQEIFKEALSISMFGHCFYHPYEFKADDNIHVLKLKNKNLSEYSKLFLATELSRLALKYSYGVQLRLYRFKKDKVLLPVKEGNIPDWETMDKYVKYIIKSKLEKL